MNSVFENFKKQYNIDFTEQQKKVIDAVDGPILTLACAGSGKTTAMLARVGNMVQYYGISPKCQAC